MSDAFEVKVPDIGDFEAVDVVEVLVSEGDEVAEEDSLITLESDKATMDVPAPRAGKVSEVKVSAGDQVSQGDVILLLEEAGGGEEDGEEDGEDGEAEPEAGEDEGAEEERGGDGEGEGDGEERGGDDRGEDEGGPERHREADRPKKGRAASPEEDEEGEQDEEEAGEARKSAKEEKEGKAERDGERSGAPATASEGQGDLPDDASGADVVCDVLVLGSGPGGYTAAFRAADLGQETVLVERHSTLGGVCLNVGCIPSKALLHAAKVIDEVAEFADRGLVFGEPRIDLDRLRGWKDSVVERLTGGLAQLARRRDVTVVQGTGRLVSPHRLEVEQEGGTTTVGFRRAILAAGSRPIEIPGLPRDDERVMDSAAALELAEVPPRLLVVGGGIIGLEMACVYRALGSEVTVVELTDGLMPGTDRDLVRPLHQRLDLQGVRILLATRVTGAEARTDEIRVELEGDHAPSHASFDRVLVAVGRRPNGDRIGAEAAGVHVDERGYVPVDRRQRTNVPHVFAIGDLVGQPLLAHKASHEGKVAAEVAAGGKSAFDARVVPSVAYTDPQVAWVGLTETDAKAEGISYGKGSFPWAASGRSLGMGREEGMTKLLFDEETGRLLGGGIVGPSAGDLISEIALAIEMGADAADVGLTIHPHPTLSETVAFSAEAFEGTLTELYRPKKKGKKGREGKQKRAKED